MLRRDVPREDAHLGRLGGGPMTGRSEAACTASLLAWGADGRGGGGGAMSLGLSFLAGAPAAIHCLVLVNVHDFSPDLNMSAAIWLTPVAAVVQQP